ncbi:type II toxin-antitoxin system VapC family toxin [Fibrobacterota bacterium]
MMYLINTDIIIYSLKKNPKVIQRFELHRTEPKAISVITYGELVYGARRSSHENENLAKIHRLAELFPVIDVSKAVMDTFGSIKASLQSRGISIDDFDLLIGATAMIMNYTVVTNNEKHFKKISGLKVDNWTV